MRKIARFSRRGVRYGHERHRFDRLQCYVRGGGVLYELYACLKPIIGCEIDIFDGCGTTPIVLLAEHEEGYQNLVRLSFFADTDMPYDKKQITLRELGEYHAGLIALSPLSCVEISRLMISGDVEATIHRTNIYREIMGGNNFFLEIVAHKNEAQAKINSALINMSTRYGFQLVATNDVHYLKQTDAKWHYIWMCIGTQQKIYDNAVNADSCPPFLENGKLPNSY